MLDGIFGSFLWTFPSQDFLPSLHPRISEGCLENLALLILPMWNSKALWFYNRCALRDVL